MTHDCNQNIESNMCPAHCRICEKDMTNNISDEEVINDINAVLEKHGWKYRLGDYARKNPQNARFEGRITGIYTTPLTEEGYALTSEHKEYAGTTQIYPLRALE